MVGGPDSRRKFVELLQDVFDLQELLPIRVGVGHALRDRGLVEGVRGERRGDPRIEIGVYFFLEIQRQWPDPVQNVSRDVSNQERGVLGS
ncbi:hypothetical protein GCM10007061_13610 [Kocuria marina]|nr:hypothetical protein GCM10007061_13610 [Kocuria marina]